MPHRTYFRGNQAFLVLMFLIIVGIAGGMLILIIRSQEKAIADHLELSAVHARAFEDQLTRSLGAITGLSDLIAVGPYSLSPESVSQLFQRTLRQAPFIRSLSVIDGEGRIMFSSNSTNVDRIIDVEDFFPAISSDQGVLRIGSPWVGRDFAEGRRSSPKEPASLDARSFLPVLQDLGQGGPNLLAALNPDFFILYFQQRLSPQLGYVEVVRYDQLLLLSTDDRAEPGSVAVDGEIESRLAMSEMGQFEDTALNGEKTLTSYRVTRQFPLLVVVRLHRSEALSAWADESRRLLLVVGPSLLGMIILSIFLYRYQQRLVVKEVAARRREHERLAATVLANVAEAVMVTGMDNRIITVNPAFSRISGYSAAEVIGSPPEIFGAESQTATFQQEIQQALDEQGLWAGEVRHRRKNGELFVAWLSTNLVRDEAGQVTHRVTVFSDFSEHRAEVDRIEYLAHHDMLTGLPNRTLLLDRLRQGISTARRQKHLLGLIFMDLDKFKPVNDQFGHAVGDLLLQKVAERLVSTVRAADTVVRLGGDEFVVLLPILDSKKSALKIAEKLRQNLNRPFILEGQQVSISSSSGIALFPEDGANEGELLRHADSVMYRAKQDGGNRTEYT